MLPGPVGEVPLAKRAVVRISDSIYGVVVLARAGCWQRAIRRHPLHKVLGAEQARPIVDRIEVGIVVC